MNYSTAIIATVNDSRTASAGEQELPLDLNCLQEERSRFTQRVPVSYLNFNSIVASTHGRCQIGFSHSIDWHSGNQRYTSQTKVYLRCAFREY